MHYYKIKVVYTHTGVVVAGWSGWREKAMLGFMYVTSPRLHVLLYCK